MQLVPEIDLSRFQRDIMTQHEKDRLATACEDHGFFLLSGHGEDNIIERTFAASNKFFAQAKDTKMALFRDEENPLGYFDRELTKQQRDLKEVYDFKAGGYISANPSRQTRWPQDPEFRETLTEFFVLFTALSELTMQMLFVTLGMPTSEAKDRVQRDFGTQHSSAARLNYYPAHDPVPQHERHGVNELGDMALHHHTDPGAITLLLQDEQGGLQALSKADGWIDVPPKSGTIVVNVGDIYRCGQMIVVPQVLTACYLYAVRRVGTVRRFSINHDMMRLSNLGLAKAARRTMNHFPGETLFVVVSAITMRIPAPLIYKFKNTESREAWRIVYTYFV